MDSGEYFPRLIDLSGQPAPGAVPGGVASDPSAPKAKISLVGYSEDSLETIDDATLEQIHELRDRSAVVWVDIVGTGDADTIIELGKIFSIHRLALEDIVHEQQRAKTCLLYTSFSS